MNWKHCRLMNVSTLLLKDQSSNLKRTGRSLPPLAQVRPVDIWGLYPFFFPLFLALKYTVKCCTLLVKSFAVSTLGLNLGSATYQLCHQPANDDFSFLISKVSSVKSRSWNWCENEVIDMAKLFQVAPGTWYLLIHMNYFYSCPTPLLSF